MTANIDFLKESAVVNLMYNYVMRSDMSAALSIKDSPNTPFTRADRLELGKTYIESSGFPVRMEKQVGAERGEYHWGYHFFGDNGVWYKPDGLTMFDDSSGVNDIIAILK